MVYFINLRNTVFLFLLLLSSCAPATISEEKVASTEDRPNIILFVSDDHGMDALGCYGNSVIQTPHLDKLAQEGVRLTNAYCTSASCAASRSVILTGKYGHSTGAYGHVHDYHHFSTFDGEKSVANILSEHGYLTARIGKYHVAPEEVYQFEQVLNADPRSTVEMAEQCVSVLHSDRPFFLYFCPDDPHRGAPFQSTPWYKPNNFGNRPEGYSGVQAKKYNPEEVVVPDFLPDTKESRAELAEYYQSVSRIDQGFGKLMQLLDATGKADNTIIIYISDNGIAFPGAKTTVYEPGIKLPCIIKSPEITQKGRVVESMVSWVDLTPTILDMVGVQTDQTFHGRSFKNVLNQQKSADWKEVYASHIFHEITMYYPMRVVRHQNYKLIWNIGWRQEYPFASDLWAASTWQSVYRKDVPYFGKRKVKNYLFRPEFELYNLATDPHEINNLAGEEQYASVFNQLKQKIKAFQKKTKDPWIIMWDHDSSLQGTGVNL